MTSNKISGMYNFKSFGSSSWVSPKASIYGAERIEIGDNVRIDDFCILSAGEGGIVIGDNVHIACHTSIIGAARIDIGSYVGVGGHSAIYSSTDDFSGDYLIGPTINKQFTNVRSEPVTFKKYSVIGSHCVVLPGVTLEEGAAVGAMSLVKKDVPSYQIWAGNPIKFVKDRNIRMTRFVQLPESEYHKNMDWYK